MIGASSGVAVEPAGVEHHQQHDAGHRQQQAAEQRGPVQRPRAQLRERRPGRPRQRAGADQPDQIGQRQHDDHQQREQRIERRQRAPSARGGQRKSGDQQQADRSRPRSSAATGRPRSTSANQALRRPWPISCQECSSSSAHSGRASTSGPNSTPGELNAVDRQRQQHREHRLLPADDGARQQIQRPERRDRAKLRQQIDAEHVIAGERGRRCRRARTPAAGRDRCRPGTPGHRPARSPDRRAGFDTAASARPATAPPAAAPRARPPAAAGRGSVR